MGALWRAEWIDEIGDEILAHGALADGLFFVFDDDFVVVDFDDFAARDDELGVEERLERGALDDDLLGGEIVWGDGEVGDFAELGAFAGLDFEAEKGEIKLEDFADFDDIVGLDDFVFGIYHHAILGIFADAARDDDAAGDDAADDESDDFERVGVDHKARDRGNLSGGLHAEDRGADEARG